MIIHYELEERIDSSNAQEVEQTLMNNLKLFEDEIERIEFNAVNLKYMSSSGLKILLKCIKRWKNISIINASELIQTLLETVGFTDFIKVNEPIENVKENKR